MRRIALAAGLCLAAACGTDPAVAPPTDLATSASAVSALVSGSCNETNFPSGWVKRVYHCGDVVPVTSTVQEIRTAIPGAINVWNSAVFAHDGLPSFSAPGTPPPENFSTSAVTTPAITVVWGNTNGLTASPPWYCGDNLSGGTITIHRSGVKANCGKAQDGSGTGYTNASQAMSSLIAHELGHSIGFTKHLSFPSPTTGLAIRPPADHCVSALPASGSLNGTLCQTEIELLHLNYGLRDTEVSPSKHIATGVTATGLSLVNPGQSDTLTVSSVRFDHFTGPAASTLSYTWSSDDSAIATVSPGTGVSNVIQAVTPGTTTIRVRLNSTVYDQAEPLQGGAIAFTVNGPPPAPTGLSASAITGTTATIGWVNGATNAGTTTTLQYRKNGVTTWITASSTIAAGVTSFGLTGLVGLTTYDVRMWHVRNALAGPMTTVASLFSTPDPNAAIPPITNFRVTSCDKRVVGAKTFNYFQLAWASSSAPAGSTFEIGVNGTSSSAGASVILTYPINARTGEVGGYLSSPLLANRWFWIRYTRNGTPGPWTPLLGNPLASNQCANA